MGAAAETIWRVPAYLPYLQPPLTDEAVASAEEEIGYKLPDGYLDLLRKQNGGYICYSLPEMAHDTIAGIGPNFPSLTEFRDWDECHDCVSFPLQGLVPFDGDGHWHICLDYRRDSRTPSISYVDIECDRESPVAESFAAYLAMLRLRVDDKCVLEAVSDIEKVKTDLSALLGVTFGPSDTSSHGYPTQGVNLGTDEDPQWVWISPNTVPRGFVRTDHQRYSELRDLIPGEAERYPELPPRSYILSASEDVKTKVIEACARARLIVRPLGEYVGAI